MIIVGENLKSLIAGFSICPINLFDETSISLKLDSTIYRTKPNNNNIIRYGLHEVDSFYKEEKLENGELLLKSGECVLACSNQSIHIPLGYIGFVQTKGTLARLFVSSHCTDSQIEPGFKGKITLEIVNHSPYDIILAVGAPIAQLFLMRCSTNNSSPYNGKYKNSEKPTLPLPFK